MSVVVPNPHALGSPRDQAAGLRSLFRRRALRLLPVLPAGETAVQGACAALLARELAAAGHQVILLDETGAAAGILGLKPKYDLLTLIEGEQEFVGVAQRPLAGLRYVAAAAGLPALIAADAAGEAFFTGFLNLTEPADTVVLNLAGTVTPAGAVWLPIFAGPATTLLVAGTGDSDLTAAYAAIKQAQAGAGGGALFRVLVNGARNEREGRAVHAKIADAARRFLGIEVAFAGHVPPTGDGTVLGRALPSQRHPEAGQALKRLAQATASWPLAECAIDESDSPHQN